MACAFSLDPCLIKSHWISLLFSTLILGNKPTSNINSTSQSKWPPTGTPYLDISQNLCNFNLQSNRCKGVPYVRPSSYLHPKPLYLGFLGYALLSFPLSCSACLFCLLSSAAWEIHGLGSDPLYASLFSCSLLLCLLASHAFAQNAPFLCFFLSCHPATTMPQPGGYLFPSWLRCYRFPVFPTAPSPNSGA